MTTASPKFNTERASSGGRVEQAIHGELAQFSDAEGVKELGEQVGLVGAENVTIDRTSAVPNPAVEVVFDNGSHGLHGPIIAVPSKVSPFAGTVGQFGTSGAVDNDWFTEPSYPAIAGWSSHIAQWGGESPWSPRPT